MDVINVLTAFYNSDTKLMKHLLDLTRHQTGLRAYMNSILPDLSVLHAQPFDEIVERVRDLLEQNSLTFLIAAGCSKYAGLPLTDELTDSVLESSHVSCQSKAILNDIQQQFNNSEKANIETYLSELIDLTSIAERREQLGCASEVSLSHECNYHITELRTAAEEFKKAIIDVISQQVDIDIHRQFVACVHRLVRDAPGTRFAKADYFVLNYDTLIEDALSLEKISFTDGLEGGSTGWWNPTTLNPHDVSARVFKLHGSIDWVSIEDDPLPRRIGPGINLGQESDHSILIWPASTKYRETRKDPFVQLSERAWNSISSSNGSQRVLAICGYSFNDAHVNSEIENAMIRSDGNLTVIAFVSDDEPKDALEQWRRNEFTNENLLICANRGFFHGDESIRSDKDLTWWRFEHLARIIWG